MTPLIETLPRIAAIGIGATLFMDAWLMLLKAFKIPTLNFALLGRWVGHMPRGQWRHAAMAKASPVSGETALGWAVHYLTGIAFAALLVAVVGTGWLASPTWRPAVLTGMATVALPLLVMQPAMGSGIASSRTPTPVRNCVKSLANHTAFGIGLYAAALAVSAIASI